MPFAAATTLTVLISFADRFHLRSERIAGYGFLFGAPWAWLLDHSWFGNVNYAIVLWIPALLYFVCLWLLLRVLRMGHGGPNKAYLLKQVTIPRMVY